MIFHDCIAKNKDNACQIARLHSLMWWFHVKVSIEPDFIVNVYSRYMYNVDRQINGCHNVISIDVKIYNTSVVHISKNYIKEKRFHYFLILDTKIVPINQFHCMHLKIC